MNREILFKAKRKDNGEWVEGGYFSEPYTDKKYIVRWNSFGLGFNEFIEVVPDTLCQYAGLTDKNGQKIWENDILKYDKFVGYVIFKKCQYIIKWINNEHLRDDFYFWAAHRHSLIGCAGNIFDNPELLEVE